MRFRYWFIISSFLLCSVGVSAGIAAQWKLNDPNGHYADSIIDSVGDNHGTPAKQTTNVNSPVGHGQVFDGSQWITENDVIISGADYPVSLSIWARQASNQTAAILGISKHDAAAGSFRHLELWLDGGKPEMRGKGLVGDTTTPVAASAMSLNEWHLITGVWPTSTSAALYVDGVSVDTDTSFIIYPTVTSWTIGARSINNTQSDKFTGDLSDARVYSGALSANDIAHLYKGGIATMGRRFNTKKNTGLSRTRGRF